MFDFLFRYGAKITIAIHAPLERRDAAREREAARYFSQLAVGLVRTNAIPALHPTTLEEADVPGQQKAVFAAGDRREQGVVGKAVIPGVESEHSQVGRQPSQVAVHYKSRVCEEYRLRVRKNLNAVSFGELVAGGAKFSVHRHPVELGVRYTERFYDVLDGVRWAG